MYISTFTAIIFTFVPTFLLSQTILTITGPDQVVINEYSLNELDALEQTTFETENPYIDGSSEFSGPSLKLIVDLAGYAELQNDFVTLTALNDYQVKMPVVDFLSYDVILATRRDDKEMSLRDKGPIWVIYPMSDHVALQDPVYNGRLIWQLKQIEVGG